MQLRDMSKDSRLKNHDSIVLFFMAHGQQGITFNNAVKREIAILVRDFATKETPMAKHANYARQLFLLQVKYLT